MSFSASTKRTFIENLIIQLEAGEIALPSAANTLINELDVYENDMSESGTVRYSATFGFHDDCVDTHWRSLRRRTACDGDPTDAGLGREDIDAPL